MPTGTCTPSAEARDFALRGAAWSLALFGLLRLPWLASFILLPLTQWQGSVAARVFGTPVLPIEVTLACSGADAIALGAGFILAYPATWFARLTGAAGGVAMILALNTVRIGTLGQARSPSWFEALHVYVWPALLILAIAAYAFTWMRRVDASPAATDTVRCLAPAAGSAARPFRITRSFVLWTAALLVAFTAAAPLYLESGSVLVVAGLMAGAAANLLGLLGIPATAVANVLYTGRGGVLVTQECIATPLIPIYAAGVIAYAGGWPRRAALLLGGVPLFIALGIARLLVVAAPAALVEAPVVLVHAFYQLLLAGVLVCLAALWRHGAGRTGWRHAAAGTAIGAVCLAVLWPLSTPVLAATFPAAVPVADPQGALALLPAFQVALYGALCVGLFVAPQWRLCAAGLALLCVSQVAGLAMLDVLQRQADVAPHVRELRAWAVGGPLLLVIAMVKYDRPRR